jgi:hypothetical protein
MRTYHGNAAFKAAFLAELARHEAADHLVQGMYGRLAGDGTFRGCGVGCSLASLNALAGRPVTERTDQHARYPTELGWPQWLAYVEDAIFEGLPKSLARTWPRRLSEAVPVGVAIPEVMLTRVLRWCLADPTYGVRHATKDPEVVAMVNHLVGFITAAITGRAVMATGAAWIARVTRLGVHRPPRIGDDFYRAFSEYLMAELRALEPVRG